MFTAIVGFFTSLAASKGLAVAAILAPYALKATPFLVLVLACLVGYYHDDAIARWSLAIAVGSEFIAGFEVMSRIAGK